MAWLDETMRGGRLVGERPPHARAVVDARAWERAAARLAEGQCTLMGLWGEPDAVHLALEESGQVGVLSLACPRGVFPSVAITHPPALRLERTIVDLYGLKAQGAPDARRWLDHGRWGLRQPLGEPQSAADSGDPYEFRKAEGVPLHQIPVGPVHAGIIEPGHFRFTANGETVVRLEERLGYVHKGIEQLMLGAPLDRAAKLAGRVSGDSTVAYAVAFARAVEAAVGADTPARAHALRGVMAELERLANHFGDIGAICNDASFSLIHAHCGILREHVLRVADFCFGHRLMMDRVAPGGVTVDLTRSGVETLRSLILNIRKRFPELMDLYDSTASLQQRTVTTGFLSPDLARQYGAGGFVGRGSGRAFDARKAPGYAPYEALKFEVPTRSDGDVHARLSVRAAEVRQSVDLIEQILNGLPDGPIDMSGLPPPTKEAEGLALVEGFRGDILAWVRLGPDGAVARCHLRDPSWFQWPLLEAAIEGNIVADFPLCNKSFNCSYSGHDL